MTDKITIFLADDHRSFVEGFASQFRDEERIQLLDVAHSPPEMLEKVPLAKPDVLLLDYSFGSSEPDGVELAGQLLEKLPDLKIIMLTSMDEVPVMAGAFAQGISGYLLKTRSISELKKAIETVAAGFEVAEGGMMRKMLRLGGTSAERKPGKPDLEKAFPLTPSELVIALLIAEGKSTQQIAVEKFVSPNTIDTHRKHIYSKLDVHNVAELMNWLRGRDLI